MAWVRKRDRKLFVSSAACTGGGGITGPSRKRWGDDSPLGTLVEASVVVVVVVVVGSLENDGVDRAELPWSCCIWSLLLFMVAVVVMSKSLLRHPW